VKTIVVLGLVLAVATAGLLIRSGPRTPRTPVEALEQQIIGDILPAWVGTPWSYSGTAETPGSDPIACGHFVARVLEEADVPLVTEATVAKLAAGEHFSTVTD
jgi:hypothetical protein